MKIEKFWVVRDPSPASELCDILFQTDSVNELARIIVGTGIRQFEHENHAFYLDEAEARADAEARMAKRNTMKVQLRAVGNPDHREPPDIGCPSRWVEVASYEEASKVCRQYILDNDLGGGNWTGGTIKQGDKKIAYVSYNGRVWGSANGSRFDFRTTKVLYPV